MDTLGLQVVSGLSNGSIYAAMALALVMIHQTTHHINFAQGEMATFSTYLAWAMLQAGATYWQAFGATLVVSFAMGFVLHRLLLRPLEQAAALTQVMVFIALMLIFNALSGWLFDHVLKPFPSPFALHAPWGRGYLSGHQWGAMGVTLLLLVAIFCFFRFTPLGLAMRAAAQQPEAARLVGVRVSGLLALGWGLAAVLGAVAGMMVAPVVFLEPSMMAGILMYGFAAAVLGGIDNPWGAVCGGLLLGVLENLLGAYVIGNELKLSLAMVVIVWVLVLKPQGLFGARLESRV